MDAKRASSSTTAGAPGDSADYQLALKLDASGRHHDAVAALERACAARHLPSMVFLASRLLTGRGTPMRPAEGTALMADAASLGSADGALYMANLTGAGDGVAQSWRAAIDYLQLGAELGSERARAQLRLLAAEAPDGAAKTRTPPPDLWAELAARIDLDHWLRPTAMRELCASPQVRAYPALLSPAACDWIIGRAKPQLRPAAVFDHATGRQRPDAGRSNSAVYFDLIGVDVVLLLVRARLAAVLGQPVQHFEASQVLHYSVGQAFAPHFDFIDPRVAYGADPALAGQRIMTALVYLSADYAGGETDFPRLNIAHRGGAGDALSFANVDASGRPDPRTLHAGRAPSAGEKWVLSHWIRDCGPGGRRFG